jgi:hypothetical protein
MLLRQAGKNDWALPFDVLMGVQLVGFVSPSQLVDKMP